ncbi:DUF6318 family protein [Cellulomonas xiejunii]|uniref:DUF6318 family protein n=1 Tax=Cellulomonas xiejunii TaxID=2968083 RepID=A0ABY5KQS3_9CELL|nr:DUF6318 family protein [Cellulomonas xiejunii]MCC2319528.1 DUF6318 family protein [Cellulomonas xiejunii]UUI71526.1 DUF6318 family protein [Cellulomonas xiejunii]
MQMRAQVAVVVVAIALATSGCATDADPTDDATSQPPVTATATPTLSPTPSPTVDVTVPPVRPEAMATPSADGAAAAASYFISLYPYINATGDLAEWNALSSPECSFCSGITANVTDLHSRGHRNVGGAEILAASGTEVDAGRWYSARLHVRIDASVDLDAEGRVLEDHPLEDREIDIVMTWSDGWTIDEVGPAAAPAS